MVDSACRQLAGMHQEPAPRPTGALFFDWGRDPYGAGWHAWSAQVKSWRVRPKIRRPNADLQLFICGEAYAERHGWVEGAINSAEMVVQQFGVERPSWVRDTYVFEHEGEEAMANSVTQLLIALGESMTLQRVYARNPDEVMQAFGLDDKEQAAMRSGDPKKVKDAANGDASVSFIIIKFDD
jgi:hypothetical protein